MKSSNLNKTFLVLLTGIVAVLIVSEFLNARAIMYPKNPNALNLFMIGLFVLSFCAGLMLRFNKKPLIISGSIGVLISSALALFIGLSYSFNLKTDEFLLYFLATLLAALVSTAYFAANFRLLITKEDIAINTMSQFRFIIMLGVGIGLFLLAFPVMATAYLWAGVIFLVLVSLHLFRSFELSNHHH